MGETAEGLAFLARIPDRGRDDDGMEYGPHVVAAIRGEALASLGRYGEAADVVLDAVRSDGVLEADVGELVRWLLQAERSPAEITASLSCRGPRPDAGPGPPSAATPGRRPVGRGLDPVPRPPRTFGGGGQRGAPTAPGAGAGLVRPAAPTQGWRRRARWWRSGTTRGLILSSGCGPRRRSTDRSKTRAPWTWPGPRWTSWTRPPGWPPRRRSAALPRPCCRRWPSADARRRHGARRAGTVRRPPPRRPALGVPGRRPANERRLRPPARRDRGPCSRCRADHQARWTEHRRPVRGDERGSRRRPPTGERAPGRGGVPISTTSYHRDGRDVGSPWSHHGPSDFPFDVNLLVVHPDQMTDFVLDSGPGLFQGRYTIGLWVWDLHAPSPSMADASRMVHEVWTPTSWGATSASSVHGGPVHRVAVPVGGRPSRRDRCLARVRHRVGSCSHRASTTTTGSPGRIRWVPWRRTRAAFSPTDGHRLIIDTIHADRYPEEHAAAASARPKGRPDVDGAPARPVVGRRPGPAPGRCRLLSLAAPGRWRPRGGRQGDVMGDVHGGDRRRRRRWSSRPSRTADSSASETVPIPRRRVPLPARVGVGRARIWSTPAPSCGPWRPNRDVTAAKVRRARQVAARRFSRSVAVATVRIPIGGHRRSPAGRTPH